MIILSLYLQYFFKRSGVRQSQICCDSLKKVVPQLHAAVSTWFSCVELPIQSLFLSICVNAGLRIYGKDTTDVYTHSLAPNDTYL